MMGLVPLEDETPESLLFLLPLPTLPWEWEEEILWAQSNMVAIYKPREDVAGCYLAYNFLSDSQPPEW